MKVYHIEISRSGQYVSFDFSPNLKRLEKRIEKAKNRAKSGDKESTE